MTALQSVSICIQATTLCDQSNINAVQIALRIAHSALSIEIDPIGSVMVPPDEHQVVDVQACQTDRAGAPLLADGSAVDADHVGVRDPGEGCLQEHSKYFRRRSTVNNPFTFA